MGREAWKSRQGDAWHTYPGRESGRGDLEFGWIGLVTEAFFAGAALVESRCFRWLRVQRRAWLGHSGNTVPMLWPKGDGPPSLP